MHNADLETPFVKHLLRMKEIHDRKSQDYASEEDRLVNYHRQTIIGSWFENENDRTYARRIAEKLSRIATLRNKEHHANREGRDRPIAINEPLDDSFLDLCTIANIWWSDYEGGFCPVRPTGSTQGRLGGASGQDSDQHLREGRGAEIPHGQGGSLTQPSNQTFRGPHSAEQDQKGDRGAAAIPTIQPRSKVAVQIVELIRSARLDRLELDWIAREAEINKR